ncbi:amidohydrolase family protein [Amycolatopsis sp. cmx-4-61]|uniref:amidohydrolase family protein n=1 Tax=Amycolatopsis sp. cmx-4-61 TaxID=2790937 RepID=UPI00397844E4
MRMLFTGGAAVTMDPALGDLTRGDVLISGEHIVAAGPDQRDHPQARGAGIVDTTGRIVSPGFVDTHRHTWQAQLRRSIPDVTDLGAYVTSTLARIAPAYQAHDVYVGTRLAALSALDAGITTMLDFSHNARTAAHSDAAIQALVDTGIRGVHASMAPHFGDWDQQWPRDVHRLHAAHSSGTGDRRQCRRRVRRIVIDGDPGLGPRRAARPARHPDPLHRTHRGNLAGDRRHRHDNLARADLRRPDWPGNRDTGHRRGAGGRGAPWFEYRRGGGVGQRHVHQMRALHAIQRMRAVNGAYGTDAEPPPATCSTSPPCRVRAPWDQVRPPPAQRNQRT